VAKRRRKNEANENTEKKEIAERGKERQEETWKSDKEVRKKRDKGRKR
jgi:hypothetical protein